MARPRTITDDAIRRAAREVFVEHGPGAPVRLVAQKLGVSHAALFGRAGSKDQLMLDALAPETPRALARLATRPLPPDLAPWLVTLLVDLMAFFERVVPNLVVLKAAGLSLGELPDGAQPPPVALRAALARWLADAVAAGSIAPIGCEAVAHGLLGAMEARCFNAYLGGGAFAPEDAATFVRELVAGLVPFEATP